MSDTHKPGELAKRSGQYVPVGPRGGAREDREITAVAGKPLPPTKRPGERWRLADPTKHERGTNS
jgi:hypothetical protein